MVLSAILGASLLGAAIGGLGWVRRRRRIAADPGCWPGRLSRPALTRHVRRYLQLSGWTLLPAWDYADVQVRAARGKCELNLFVMDDSLCSVRTVMRDVSEKCISHKAVIGALTQQAVLGSMLADAEASGMFIIGPANLPKVEHAVRRAHAQHEAWRRAAAKP